MVVEAGSITLAAKRLHLSQPAVTAHIRQLESALGKPLLERRARGVVPTDAGRRLIPIAAKIEDLLEEAQRVAGAVDTALGPLVLGASTTIASCIVPSLIAEFVRRHGARGVRVEVGNTAQILAWVEDGSVPLGLVEGHPRAARVRLERFIDDELVPMVATRGPRELTAIRTLAQLRAATLLFREPGSGTRDVVERALRRQAARSPVETDLVFGSTEAIRNGAVEGLGVAFLSRFVAAHELASGRLRILAVPGLEIRRSFSWAMRTRELTPTAARFYELAMANPPTP